jgi:hypothetical protein
MTAMESGSAAVAAAMAEALRLRDGETEKHQSYFTPVRWGGERLQIPTPFDGFLMGHLPFFYDFLRSIRCSGDVQYADVFELLFSL